MTVPNQGNRINYTANGATGTFAYPYSFIDSSHVKVLLDGVLQASGYSVVGSNVVFDSNPTNGTLVTIYVETPITQTQDYEDYQKYSAEVTERGFDKAIIIANELKDEISRSAKIPRTSSVSDVTLPEPVDGRALIWSGVSGDIKNSSTNLNVYDSLANLLNSASTGIFTITSASAAASRTITGTANKITVTNGDGVSGNPTLNIGSDVVTLTDTQTLTNKTLTSPTLTTPNLGTPSAVTLTNATGLPLTTGVTGILPVASGGTGQSTALGAAQSFTPTWLQAGGGTNPSIGSGTISGRYQQVGKMIHVHMQLVMAADTTYGSGGSGYWEFGNLPEAVGAFVLDGSATTFVVDNGSGYIAAGATSGALSATSFFLFQGNPASFFSSTFPIPWANGDVLRINLVYEGV